ncbi:MAG: glycosyltransferase [Solirubrobacterales bacterium]
MASDPEIAVIVPSHKAEGTLGACLDGILAQTLASDSFEIRVVDSGADSAREIVAARADRHPALHLHEAERLGPGAQRNQGAGATTARFLAFTDADCVPEPRWLEAGFAHLKRGVAIVQGPTLTPDGAPPPPYAHAIFLPGPSPLFESCNIMYEAEGFRRAGGFSTDLFEAEGSHMGEDTELAWRVRRDGGTVAWEPAAVVRHAVSARDFGDQLSYEWQARFFPRLVRRVPELRGEALTARVFLSPRTMRASAALAAVALAPRTRWALPAALPYLAALAREARAAPTPRNAAGRVARRLVSDGARQAGLLWGSARYRSPVL